MVFPIRRPFSSQSAAAPSRRPGWADSDWPCRTASRRLRGRQRRRRRRRRLGRHAEDRLRQPADRPGGRLRRARRYVLDLARKAFADGLTVGGKKYDVTIIDKDGQSDPARAAQVANDLINGEGIDLMLTTSTPETVNPVSDACEAAGVPCISTVVPWEAWYFGRGAKPDAPAPPSSTRTTSASASSSSHRPTRTCGRRCTTNKKVGVMWPNDADGNAIRAALGPLMKKAGYKIVDPGAYNDGTNDYSSQIAKFKPNGCEIFNTFPIPPDFATFWQQAAQQGYKPKIAQIAKTGLFPSQVEALGPTRRRPGQRGLLDADLPVHARR